MRVVIDLQAAQATNCTRGIGRYSLAHARSMIKAGAKHQFVLALNGRFGESIESIRAEFDDILDQDNIRVWQGVEGVSYLKSDSRWKRKAAEKTYEAFLLSLKPDVIHVASLFEGFVDDAVTSIGEFSTTVPVATTVYDLIPLIYSDYYLQNDLYASHYWEKIAHLRRSDLMLAISESSRIDLLTYLNVPEDRAVNISGAISPVFRSVVIDHEAEHALRQKYGLLNKRFVLYTGGIDYRKNVEGLIRSFAMMEPTLRQDVQLVIVCSVQAVDRERLTSLAGAVGLREGQLILTGFIPDDDLVALYNICGVFCFPSLYEGFGLPVLEAMACGAAVIASDTSSMPEIVGRGDATFSPTDEPTIARAMERVLSDEGFRTELKLHGLARAKEFSWDITGARTIDALERRYQNAPDSACTDLKRRGRRPRLLHVSPLPPQRTGIAEYSNELLQELSSYYEVEAIVSEPASCGSTAHGFTVRSIEWFYENAGLEDRIVYHFGNSSFHSHMFEMLCKYPGIVVLHDFFLSAVIAHRELHEGKVHSFTEALYASHGYPAVAERFGSMDGSIWQYPANFPVLQAASGVVVHSEYAKRLARKFYGEAICSDWWKIAHLRKAADRNDRMASRSRLQVGADDFIVCSFGHLGPIKSSDRILRAWLSSPLASDPRCRLVFVGELHDGEFARGMRDGIDRSPYKSRILITGYATTEAYRDWLSGADLAVQVRVKTRGETSGAVLDCLNYGLPTVINAHGSLDDFAEDCVFKLSEYYSDEELADALTSLWKSREDRDRLRSNGLKLIRTEHSPHHAGLQYCEAIEYFQHKRMFGRPGLINSVSLTDDPSFNEYHVHSVAAGISASLPLAVPKPRIFVDISELVVRDSGSGIQRVVRNILRCLFAANPEGYRIEPVYATRDAEYRIARQFTMRFLGCPDGELIDEFVEPQRGDIFFGLDLQPAVVPCRRREFDEMRAIGVAVYFVVYDLLCIRRPEFFIPGAYEYFRPWLDVVAQADGVICISRSVADDLHKYLVDNKCVAQRPFNIGYVHLGAELDVVRAPVDCEKDDLSLSDCTTILMVGTIEPRKGYAQALAAFETLWASGVKVNLVIVGKPGWMTEALIQRMEGHEQAGKHLYMFTGADDGLLERLYKEVNGLLVASEAEGFGLPIVEAARFGIPLLLRDIDVFREVAQDKATYFSGNDAEDLADALRGWIRKLADGAALKSTGLDIKSWKDCAHSMLGVITQGRWYRSYQRSKHDA